MPHIKMCSVDFSPHMAKYIWLSILFDITGIIYIFV